MNFQDLFNKAIEMGGSSALIESKLYQEYGGQVGVDVAHMVANITVWIREHICEKCTIIVDRVSPNDLLSRTATVNGFTFSYRGHPNSGVVRVDLSEARKRL